jgi:hypothetical protein
MTGLENLEKPDVYSLSMNVVPFVHLASGLGVAFGFLHGAGARVALLLVWIYLLPPLVARLTQTLFGTPVGRVTLDTRGYRVWWFLTQLQTLFNRLPWVEELLRMVPGLYSVWIRIWGGHVSPFAYIGPRVLITDRHLVNVGRGAVLGLQGALAAHMAIRDENGRYVVVLAAPTVEPEAILGGDAGLGPGAILRAGHLLPTGRRVGPFDEWPRRKAVVTDETA